MGTDDERRLAGGWQSEVTRRGDVVFRSSGPQSRTVMALLQHLHAHGFDAAPRPVGRGSRPTGANS